jgi:mannose/cellobiose epimerase-like protein (N-acyl-D-glucosamine 2-epimerase family)
VTPKNTIRADVKHDYGNVHPLFALAQVYGVTMDRTYLDAALRQLDVIEKHFLDPEYPDALRPTMSRDFSRILGSNGSDPLTHYFEALLALFDVTECNDKRRVAALIDDTGNFLATRLYRDQEGFTDRGYIAFNDDEQWNPQQDPYSRQTQWGTAYKLIRFCREYAINPNTGGMIHRYLTDQEYGGWYRQLWYATLQPDILDKGEYHYSMFFAEAIRLGKEYFDKIAALNDIFMTD